MTTNSAARPARRSDRSRQAILTAALELLDEVGYHKLTIEAIAARAGAGKQTIYRWWPSKIAVVTDAFRHSLGGEPAVAPLPDTGDLRADMREVLHAIVAELHDPRYEMPARAMIAESQHDPELNAQITELMLRPALDASAARIRVAQRAGRLRDDVDAETVAELLYGPLHYRWLNRTGTLDREYADTVLSAVLDGLAVGD
ncbi:TetR family transcriptional regulator [Stackebrandtia albiflava]|uniref:TetR family transcriptional regulator n=1 Tax=Stackebrandtia albiflava TaxID=406432 RepID=A0A562V9V9_9ACTN|nr:TetR/AcrR family transcriptional regulator [Stackebrandtia albiflava]TWJ14670.1 TetR family transcriptional regulator [Stackebrandtia albiflava]